jgi:hypothetical protein
LFVFIIADFLFAWFVPIGVCDFDLTFSHQFLCTGSANASGMFLFVNICWLNFIYDFFSCEIFFR